MLPLEAIELDAFRRRREHDTFWCGLLLGGCGLQLTTKLYTDRVCHFAHHPGPDGHPHLCGRRARGVSSADHLYAKSAAAAWLRDRGRHPDIEFARPDGVPIGSVVDIRFQHGGLRVHLDQAVQPVWDQDGHEPVLGMSVPVDRDTLIDRWYVHRITAAVSWSPARRASWRRFGSSSTTWRRRRGCTSVWRVRRCRRSSTRSRGRACAGLVGIDMQMRFRMYVLPGDENSALALYDAFEQWLARGFAGGPASRHQAP
ncbi:hypothetical protein [Streptomyces griseofuscus]|uniref:hypothetical protein n=1 Tax=Streptomyces griseofuscus TaxID=146922 RepID=UPI00340B79B7